MEKVGFDMKLGNTSSSYTDKIGFCGVGNRNVFSSHNQ